MLISIKRRIVPLTNNVSNKSNLLLHPIILFVSVWVLSFALYAMHLSDLLTFSAGQVGRIVLWVIIPYVCTILLYQAFYYLSPKKARRPNRCDIHDGEYLALVEARIYKWFAIWCAFTIVEIILSGGLPIIWLIRGSSLTYVDFGIHTMHGILNTVVMVLSLAEFGLFVMFGGRRRLLIPCWVILWSLLTISRAIMIIVLMQWFILWFCIKGIHIGRLVKLAVISITTILLFGYIGDMRSGIAGFRDIAQPSKNYPEWLPSGFLWFYIYITSPLGNLVNTSITTTPLYSLLFPNTLFESFPTVIKNLLYGDYISGASPDLVTNAFTVSTGYISFFCDYGVAGMIVFSVILAIAAAYYWRKRQTFHDGLMYAIVAQCLLSSIFVNFLVGSQFICQFFCIYFLFRPHKLSRRRNAEIIPSRSAGTAGGITSHE